MSNDRKFVARPKVRFSQIDNRETEDLKVPMEKKRITARSDGPKIQSIVALKNPVKIVNLSGAPQPQGAKNRDLHGGDNAKEIQSTIQLMQRTSSWNKTVKLDNEKRLNDASNIENIKKNFGGKDVRKHSNLFVNDSVENPCSLPIPIAQDEAIDDMVKSQANTIIDDSGNSMKNKKGKENESSEAQKNLTTSIKKTVEQKPHKLWVKNHRAKKPNVPGKVPADVTKQNSRMKPAATNAMPCLTHNNKVRSKMKISPVKKTLVRDIEGHKMKPTVAPGFLRQRHDDINEAKSKERVHASSNVSGDKLKRPEYNSIMCTINKLNKVKEEKVVTDIDHLPPAYRNFVHGKISAALDYPLDEAIYKNLVDLSVDEQQLPIKLMRSKDPEPRRRDIVPVLSDFFEPVSAEEYRTPVSVKPRIPEVTDNWNACGISDKIFEWKHSMDHA